MEGKQQAQPLYTPHRIIMTKEEAQAIIVAYMEDWANNIMPDFVEDSISNGTDDEAKEALELVGTDFEWFASIKTDAPAN